MIEEYTPKRGHPAGYTDTPTRILATLIAAERAGRALTIREVQRVCGLSSTSVVQYNMRKLERDGDIVIRDGESRGYTVTAQGRGLPSDAELLAWCLQALGSVDSPLVRALRERLK